MPASNCGSHLFGFWSWGILEPTQHTSKSICALWGSLRHTSATDAIATEAKCRGRRLGNTRWTKLHVLQTVPNPKVQLKGVQCVKLRNPYFYLEVRQVGDRTAPKSGWMSSQLTQVCYVQEHSHTYINCTAPPCTSQEDQQLKTLTMDTTTTNTRRNLRSSLVCSSSTNDVIKIKNMGGRTAPSWSVNFIATWPILSQTSTMLAKPKND